MGNHDRVRIDSKGFICISPLTANERRKYNFSATFDENLWKSVEDEVQSKYRGGVAWFDTNQNTVGNVQTFCDTCVR
jgi:hypothetical protein